MQRPQRYSLTQQCVESMKRYIGATLKPGERLPAEQEWGQMLGISRLVVRETRQVLAGMGLIDVQQGRGAFVRDSAQISVFDQLTFAIDLHELQYSDVFEARAMLDLAVLELCILRADPQVLADLEAILRSMQQALEHGEPEHAHHRAFHQRMLQATGNPLIERIGRMLMDAFWRIGDNAPNLVYPSTHQHGYDQIESHRSLIEEIRISRFGAVAPAYRQASPATAARSASFSDCCRAGRRAPRRTRRLTLATDRRVLRLRRAAHPRKEDVPTRTARPVPATAVLRSQR